MASAFPLKSTAIVAALTASALVLAASPATAEVVEVAEEVDAATLTIDGADTSIEMSEDLYGVFYEDINYAADGGLYAELVRNRSFEFNSSDHASFNALTAWSKAGSASLSVVNDAGRLNDMNRNYMVLQSTAAGDGMINSSYNEGVAVEARGTYDFSVWARSATAQTLRVAVTDASGNVTFAESSVSVDGSNTWEKLDVALTSTVTSNAGRLRIEATAAGSVSLDMVSLFPSEQYVGPVNGAYGIRKDLADRIEALNPSFLRFPGGCVTNVGTFETYEESGYTDRTRTYQWKETIGPVEERPANWNIWGYNQSYGIGYLEYFKFAEDIGAFALPVVSVGANGCGSNIPELKDRNSDLFKRWVQDTVDLIEFAIGDVTTEWGAVRADLGHPEPFEMPYIGLGNEENTTTFEANFSAFRDAIEAKFPQVEIISNSGPAASGGRFNTLWNFNRAQDVAVVDEHYYMEPNWFLDNTHRYDSYDREGPHVFLGEYAARGNAVRNALAEAAYLTGIERNSDVVDLASYAPLLANEDYVQWTPDAIWFDNDESWGSVNYWVQHMFSNNRGTQVVPSTFAPATTASPVLSGGVLLSTWQTAASYDDLVVTGGDGGVLFEDNFDAGAAAWTPASAGWSVNAGRYTQNSETTTDARSVVTGSYGNDWSNYTVELNASKESGAEGFLVGFAAESTGDYYWWNIGGWGNTRSALEKASGGTRVDIAEGPATRIVNGRQYDIKIEVEDDHINLFLDGVLQISYDVPVPSDVYQVVTRDADAGEIIVKAVNTSDEVRPVDVVVNDVTVVPEGASVLEMVGPSQGATNTKAVPDAIVPVSRDLAGVSNDFRYELPARSISFLRLPYTSIVVPPEPLSFIDVPGGHKFFAEVSWLANEGISTGWNTSLGREYRPEVNVKREEMAAFLYRSAGEPAVTLPSVSPFADVGEDHTFYREIVWMYQAGISKGWNTTKGKQFRPDVDIKREEMAAFLYRSSGEPPWSDPATSPFVDVKLADTFFTEITWLIDTGVSTGWNTKTGKQYRPDSSTNREQMAAFLYRLSELPNP